MITLEMETFYLVTCYTPNTQEGLRRLDYRLRWERDFQAYIRRLDEKKPVIICGDLNVAHEEIDLKNPKTNRKSAGFTDDERREMSRLLGQGFGLEEADGLTGGFVDSYREQNPDSVKYSWWSYRFHAREKNIGWRIDYFIMSERIKNTIISTEIHSEIEGSDHCPVELTTSI